MRAAQADARRERGFTLIEVIISAGLLLLIGGSVYWTLAQRPAQARSTAIGLRAFIEEARSLAAVTGAATTSDGSGATIGVIREGATYVATLYAYRPITGTPAPVAEPNTAPFRTSTAIALHVDGRDLQPPFALFFSVSGHVSAHADFIVGRTPPLSVEPECPLTTGIALSFRDTKQTQIYTISCEMAQLDVAASAPGIPAR